MTNRNIEQELLPSPVQFLQEKDYWLDKLSGDLTVSCFPCDYYKTGENPDESGVSKIETDYLNFRLEGELYSRLLNICQNSDSRLFILLVIGLMLLLQKYTGNHDIIIGAPIDKQESEKEYINTILALRCLISPENTIREFLPQVRQTIVEACENQNYPIETLSYELNITGTEKDGFSLFDLAVLLKNIHDINYIHHLQLNMIFSFQRTDECIEGEIRYNPLLYKKESIARIAGHLTHLLHEAFNNPGGRIADLDILTEEERERLLVEMNGTDAEYPGESTIHELFEKMVEKNPAGIAVEEADSGRSLTYTELNQKAGQLSELLREKGITRGMIAAIMGEHSLEIVIGILAILKAGGLFLPLDAQNPDERIKFIAADSGAHLFLSQTHIISGRPELFSHFPPGSVIHIDDPDNYMAAVKNAGSPARSSDPAYIIYTSGTTGKPKGVVIQHKALVNYINFAGKSYVKDESGNFPLYSSIAFDLTITSIFTPLVTGNRVIIYHGWDKGNLIERIIDDNRVDIVKLTPSHLYLIKDKKIEKTSRIKRFIVGGEALSPQLAGGIYYNFKGDIEIFNEYGPTEATVGCMLYKYNPKKDSGRSIPIGIPIDNTQIYLLDKNLKPVPGGAIGELYIAGTGIAQGYLNQPELTSQRFIQSTITADTLYKTGDMARWLTEGTVEFLGRSDQQVKIRGFRIEPGEIENKLLKYNGIKEAVVLPMEDNNGNKYLCAYITFLPDSPHHAGDLGLLNLPDLKESLAAELPDYMVPSYFINLEKIPLNANGKIDRDALPDPADMNTGEIEAYVPPGNIIEEKLVEVWQKVLGRDDVGINHNFFMIGGDSIKSIQIIARMSSAGYKIEMRDLFQYPTISGLARMAKISDHIANQGIITGIVPLTPTQQDFFQLSAIDRHHYNQSVMLYAPGGFDADELKAIFSKLQQHHDILRLTIKEENGEIIQQIHGSDYPLSLEEFDFRDRENAPALMETKANQIQAGINLEQGPVLKLGLFRLRDGDRLLIVIHHMATDGISWRILFEDIETLHRQYENKEKMELPNKTDSFKVWAEKLAEFANSKAFLDERSYWRKLDNTDVPPLKKDYPDAGNRLKDRADLSFRLSREDTELLLTKVHEAFGTEINDILLMALGLAIRKNFNIEKVLIALEGHGREQLMEGVDINRTVGWFTSIYPVILDMSHHNDMDRQIKEIKEHLHQIPNKGVGYGILKYLTKKEYKQELTFEQNPRISFNYLGQFDSDLGGLSFQVARESSGNNKSLNRRSEYELDVTGIITGKQLILTIAYNTLQYEAATIEALLGYYKEELMHLITYCCTREERELTPSDLTYKELSLDDIDEIESLLDV